MTSPSFNPYHEWLGIDPSISAPDHYQLIGVPRDEQNPETISRAADAAMSRVRQVRPGDKSQEWARVLDELREAKSCLTNQGRRGEYDRQLPPATRPEPSAMAPTNNASPSASNYSPSSQAPTTDSPHAPTAGSPMANTSAPVPMPSTPHAAAHDVGQPDSNGNASPMATPATAYGQPANAWPNANVPMAGYSPPANPTPAANSTPMASPVPMAGYATPMPSQAPYAGHPAPMASPAIGQPSAMSGYGNAPYANANYGMYPGFSPAPFAQPNGGSVVTSPQQAAPQAVSAWGQSPYGVASPQQAPMASAVPTAYAPALGVPAIGYASPAAPSASP
ncbi:MAG: hypothetical protein KDA59_04415, partial [Planctomycetales bacterium]|nr:hypothetical protein [Planctomycetales bacterium]